MRLKNWLMGLAALAGTLLVFARFRRHVSLDHAVVLITGGSRGLGLALAREFARHASRLALVARDPSELQRAADSLRATGAEVFTIAADIRDRAAAEDAVNKTLAHYGQIDVLVNNAGIITVGPLEDMTLHDFEDSLATHAWGPLSLMKAVAPQMKARGGGRIVNIASIGGKIAVPHLAAYALGKFALVGLSDAFRAELAKDRIRVTTVCPGLLRTGSHLNAVFKGQSRREYGWFALAGATPATSIGARRAARQIVRACRDGRPQLIITRQAKLAVLLAALFPNLAALILQTVNKLLPAPVQKGDTRKLGKELPENLPMHFATRLLRAASAENNERGSPDGDAAPRAARDFR